MAKKTKKTTTAQSRGGAKSYNRPAGRGAGGKAASTSVTASRAHAHAARGPRANLQAVRIVAAVVAVLLLAGGIAIAVRAAGDFPATLIIEIVLLALIVGFSIFAAVRPETAASWFERLGK